MNVNISATSIQPDAQFEVGRIWAKYFVGKFGTFERIQSHKIIGLEHILWKSSKLSPCCSHFFLELD